LGQNLHRVQEEICMKESKQKRNRRCKECPNVIYGDAQRMREHREEHKVVRRAKAAGLVVPKSVGIQGGVLI
jgi:ribosomal protein L37E